MLDLNQRPKDSGLCPFLDSLDYAFAIGQWPEGGRRLVSTPSRYFGLGSALPCASRPSGFTDFDAIHAPGFPGWCTTFAMSPLL